MKKNFLAAALLAAIFNAESRSFLTPIPHSLGYFYPDLFNPKGCVVLGNEYGKKEECLLNIFPQVTFYNRTANQAFDKCDNNERNLSYLFHGNDNFDLSDLFQDAQTPEFPGTKFLDALTVCPKYDYLEQGCLLGLHLQKVFRSCKGREITVSFSAKMPIKKISVDNCKGYDSLNTKTSGLEDFIQTELFDTSIDDNGNKIFSARMDVLKDNNIIKLASSELPEKYYVTNKNINISSAANLSDPALNLVKMDFSTSPTGINYGAGVENIAGTYTVVPQATIIAGSVDLNASGNNKFALPIELYSIASAGDIRLFDSVGGGDGESLRMRPEVVGSQKSQNDIYYVTNLATGVSSGATILANTDYKILALTQTDGSTIAAQGNVTFQTPPVIVVKSTTGLNPTSYQMTLQNHPSDINGAYGTYAPTTDLLDGGFLNNNGSFKVNVTETPGSGFINIATGAPAAENIGPMWYTEDYTTFFDTADLSQYYLVTSLTADGNPTSESLKLYEEVGNLQIDQTNKLNQNALTTGTQFLKGKYVDGINGILKNGCPIDWNCYNKQGIGDLDLQLGLGTNWCDCSLIGDILFGLVVPTASKINPCKNYLTMPLGNNGHYEVRLAGQLVYDFCDWGGLAAYGGYTWALSKCENIIPSFQGSKAFGLIPSCIQGNVSWQQFVLNTDLTLYPYESCGIDFGYQYMHKREDKFCQQPKTALNGLGEMDDVDFDSMQCFTKRNAHTFKTSLFTELSDCSNISFGFSKVFAGKNIPKVQDLFVTFVMQF